MMACFENISSRQMGLGNFTLPASCEVTCASGSDKRERLVDRFSGRWGDDGWREGGKNGGRDGLMDVRSEVWMSMRDCLISLQR